MKIIIRKFGEKKDKLKKKKIIKRSKIDTFNQTSFFFFSLSKVLVLKQTL